MSEILTREQVVEALRGSWHVGSARILTPATHRQMIDSHLALHDAHDAALKRDDVWKGIVHDFLVTMIDMAVDDDADSRERRRKDAYARTEAALAAVATPQGQEVPS